MGILISISSEKVGTTCTHVLICLQFLPLNLFEVECLKPAESLRKSRGKFCSSLSTLLCAGISPYSALPIVLDFWSRSAVFRSLFRFAALAGSSWNLLISLHEETLYFVFVSAKPGKRMNEQLGWCLYFYPIAQLLSLKSSFSLCDFLRPAVTTRLWWTVKSNYSGREITVCPSL